MSNNNKTVYLHIGCGKTGSSALQLWLKESAPKLMRNGVFYPVFDDKSYGPYEITCGNGTHLVAAIRKDTSDKLIDRCLEQTPSALLFSSEQFQVLSEEELEKLKDSITRRDANVKIISYIRDVYGMFYSSYLQLVKRHLYSEIFKVFAIKQRTLQQFNVVARYEKIFTDINVIHYETEKNKGLNVSFCASLGISSDGINPMRTAKVNRSLTPLEASLMVMANKAYKDRFRDTSNADHRFSIYLSDSIIHSEPEKETPIFLDLEVLKYLKSTFAPEISRINKKYFHDNRLKIISDDTTNRIHEWPEVPSELLTLVNTVVSNVDKFDFETSGITNKESAKSNAEHRVESDLIGRLYAEARKREVENVEQAKQIIKVALILRPDGKVIREYLEQLEDKNTKSLQKHM